MIKSVGHRKDDKNQDFKIMGKNFTKLFQTNVYPVKSFFPIRDERMTSRTAVTI